LATHQNTCRYESKIFMFAQDKFFRYVTTSFLQEPNIVHCNVKTNILSLYNLYQIDYLSVKENLWIMSGYLFWMWLCLRRLIGHSKGELVLKGIIMECAKS